METRRRASSRCFGKDRSKTVLAGLVRSNGTLLCFHDHSLLFCYMWDLLFRVLDSLTLFFDEARGVEVSDERPTIPWYQSWHRA